MNSEARLSVLLTLACTETSSLVRLNAIEVYDSLMGQKRQSHINSPVEAERR